MRSCYFYNYFHNAEFRLKVVPDFPDSTKFRILYKREDETSWRDPSFLDENSNHFDSEEAATQILNCYIQKQLDFNAIKLISETL